MAAVMAPKRELHETQMLHQKVFVRSSRGRATKVSLLTPQSENVDVGCEGTLFAHGYTLWLGIMLRM